MSATRERILLVESDPEISDLISRQTLRPLGYQVEVVGAAASAIQEAVRYGPDVIIANLNLPGLSGKDLLVALSSQGLDIPILVIAPKGMESDVIQAFRLGATDFLYWPIREAEVVAAVERVLKQVRARREREILSRQLNQANQELQRRVRELTTIFAIGKAVITATDLQILFNKLVEGANFVTEADSGWLMVRDERSKTFILRACRNTPPEINGRLNQPFDDGLSSLVALSGEALSIHGEPLQRFKVARVGQSALAVPVKIKNEVVGLIVVVRREGLPFNSGQQALLEAVADYASIALVNARLFKALEERLSTLQQSADTSKVDERIRDEMLKEVNQELRAHLKVVKGNVDLLSGKEKGRLNAEQTAVLNAVREKLKTVVEIVESMRSLHPAEASKQRVSIDLVELGQQAVNRFQPIARQGQMTILAELSSSPVNSYGDASQISTVFDGLLSNAIKYSRPGARINLRVESKNNQTQVTVKDSGIGIAPEHVPHIFESSYKVDGVMPGRYGGVGIGLPLIKDIIEAHGGKVWIESKPDEGSTFYFSLPGVSK